MKKSKSGCVSPKGTKEGYDGSQAYGTKTVKKGK